MRVVLADDHAIVRSGLRWALEGAEGVTVVGEAADGTELLEVLATVAADVVVLDLRMPGVGGLEVLPAIRRRHPDIPVVVLSMHDEPASIRAAIERGAAGYLLKSAGLEELLQALAAAVGGRAYIQPILTQVVLREATTPADRLPERCVVVLRRVASGASTTEIARDLDVSESTVKADLQQVFDALAVSSRAEAVAVAMRLGLID